VEQRQEYEMEGQGEVVSVVVVVPRRPLQQQKQQQQQQEEVLVVEAEGLPPVALAGGFPGDDPSR
jgi:hypothetical protein